MTEAKDNIKSNGELIQVGKNCKSSLDLNNLESKNWQFNKTECMSGRNLSSMPFKDKLKTIDEWA